MAKISENCDLCGTTDQLYRAMIEGVEMSVCKKCASFGKILVAPRTNGSSYFQQQKQREPLITETIVDEYALKIKQARERRKLNQEEFAKLLNEHQSLLQRIESGKQKPTIELARKFEKMLAIVLVEKQTEEKEETQQQKSKGPLTIGDILAMKK